MLISKKNITENIYLYEKILSDFKITNLEILKIYPTRYPDKNIIKKDIFEEPNITYKTIGRCTLGPPIKFNEFHNLPQ